MMGHVEKDAYMVQWIFCPRRLRNLDGSPHPPVKHPFRSIGALLLSVVRMYLIFALPLNIVPCRYAVLPLHLNDTNFKWVTLFHVLPDHLPWFRISVPTFISHGDHTELLHWFVLIGYWSLLLAAIIGIL